MLRRHGELVDGGAEPATPEQQQRALAVHVGEEVVGTVTGGPAGREGHPVESRVDAARLHLGLRQGGEDAGHGPDSGRRYALRGRPVRGLVVGLDTERPQGSEAAGGAGRRTPARVVRDGLPVQGFGVGDAS